MNQQTIARDESETSPDIPVDEQASSTAELVAMFRAGEYTFPAEERIYSDPFAHLFISDRRYRFLLRHRRLLRLVGRRNERRHSGVVGVALLRCRYAQDALSSARAEGVSQLVVIGAGYDSTAAMTPAAAELAIYELDLRATQARKRAILETQMPDALERSTLVPCDLRRETVSSVLARTDFDPQRPAVFNWLGVTMFIPPQAIDFTMRDLASVAAPGSRLVFDYMEASVIDGTTSSVAAKRVAADVEARGEAFRFGLRHGEAGEWLSQFGFEVRDQGVCADVLARYFPDGAHRSAAEFMGLVLAERV